LRANTHLRVIYSEAASGAGPPHAAEYEPAMSSAVAMLMQT